MWCPADMYPLEFSTKTPHFSEDWTLAVDPKEIQGPVVLAAGSRCVSNFEWVEFLGEPTSVEQVLVAAWIDNKLALKNVQGKYIECIDGQWSATSKAVSQNGLFSVEEGWSFFSSGNILKIGDISKFQVFVRNQPVEIVPLTIAELENKAGGPLDDRQVLELYRAADRGELNEKLAQQREKGGSRV